MKKICIAIGTVLVLLIFQAPNSIADVTLAPYPAPGGNTAASTGDPGRAGGATWTLDDFNFTAFCTLYYGIGRYTDQGFIPDGPVLYSYPPNIPAVLSYEPTESAFDIGKVVWTGTTGIVWTYGSGWITSTVDTRFTLTVTDTSDTPIALIDAGTIDGMPLSLGGVHTVTGAFKANWLFEIDAPDTAAGNWEPALDMFDRIENDPAYPLISNVGGAFYYVPDSDGDGICDEEDDCSGSDIGTTVVIDGCDSEVENQIFDNGCSMNDLIDQCAVEASNHGKFVSCVSHLSNEWKANDLVSGSEKGSIQSCAAKADIP